MSVYKKVHEVQAAMAKAGIEKGQRNTHGNYNFRGIDDVQNALAPILSEVGLLIIPSVVGSANNATTTSGGKPTNHWRVEVEYKLIDPDCDSEDGRMMSARFHGEAYDTSDKGLQKAITSAYKYFLFEALCIPVQGTGDADGEHLEAEGDRLVGEEEVGEMLLLCSKTNTDAKAFCEYLQVPRLDQLPLSKYASAIGALNAKLQKMTREYEQAQNDTHQSLEGEVQ